MKSTITMIPVVIGEGRPLWKMSQNEDRKGDAWTVIKELETLLGRELYVQTPFRFS